MPSGLVLRDLRKNKVPAILKDTALALTASQPKGWETILVGLPPPVAGIEAEPLLNTFPASRLGTRLYKPLGIS